MESLILNATPTSHSVAAGCGAGACATQQLSATGFGVGGTAAAVPTAGPRRRTQQPIVTGTSVVAVKYKGGVMMAADTLGSYGGLARFKNISRITAVGTETLVGFGGDLSDFQYISDFLGKLTTREQCLDDGCTHAPQDIHSYLTRVLYARRSNFNPLWCSLVTAGVRDGEVFLGTTDLIGTAFTDDFLCTGFGKHLAMPIIREHWKPDMAEAEARDLVERCMRTLYYRDCRTINRITFATVAAAGGADADGDAAMGGGDGEEAAPAPAAAAGTTIKIDDPVELETKWDYASFIAPKAGDEFGGSW